VSMVGRCQLLCHGSTHASPVEEPPCPTCLEYSGYLSQTWDLTFHVILLQSALDRLWSGLKMAELSFS
jgi:hypothetical protein